MARGYSSGINQIATTAAMDIVSGYNSTTNALIKITRIWAKYSPVSVIGNQQLAFELLVCSAATLGSGGTTTGAYKDDPGDPNSATSLHQGDTTVATGLTVANAMYEACNIFQGLDRVMEKPILVPSSGGSGSYKFIFRLINAPSASINLSAGIGWTEEGI